MINRMLDQGMAAAESHGHQMSNFVQMDRFGLWYSAQCSECGAGMQVDCRIVIGPAHSGVAVAFDCGADFQASAPN